MKQYRLRAAPPCWEWSVPGVLFVAPTSQAAATSLQASLWLHRHTTARPKWHRYRWKIRSGNGRGRARLSRQATAPSRRQTSPPSDRDLAERDLAGAQRHLAGAPLSAKTADFGVIAIDLGRAPADAIKEMRHRKVPRELGWCRGNRGIHRFLHCLLAGFNSHDPVARGRPN